MRLDTKINFDSSTCTYRCNITPYFTLVLVKPVIYIFVSGRLLVIHFEKSYIAYLDILKTEFKLLRRRVWQKTSLHMVLFIH